MFASARSASRIRGQAEVLLVRPRRLLLLVAPRADRGGAHRHGRQDLPQRRFQRGDGDGSADCQPLGESFDRQVVKRVLDLFLVVLPSL